MKREKDKLALRNLKFILIDSIPISLFSGYLTGVRLPPILIDGQVIDRGYYEHFTFLIISAVVLLMLLFFLHFFVRTLDNKMMKFGIGALSVSLISFCVVLLLCILSSLFNVDGKWGNSEFFMVFFAAIPLTIIFLIGFLLLIYGKVADLMVNKRRETRHLS
jgi:hypothetical protein